jgi:hypothetical protein
MGVVDKKAVSYWIRFEEYSRPAKISLLQKLHDPQFRRLCLVLGAAFMLMGIADWVFNSFFLRASQSVHGQLLPGFRTPKASYKKEIVDYLVVVVFAAILMAACWTINFRSKILLIKIDALNTTIPSVILFGVGYAAPVSLSAVCFFLAAVAFGLRSCGALISESAQSRGRSYSNQMILGAMLVGSIVIASTVIYRSSTPAKFPSEFYELPDEFLVAWPWAEGNQAPIKFSRTELVDCLAEPNPGVLSDGHGDASKKVDTARLEEGRSLWATARDKWSTQDWKAACEALREKLGPDGIAPYASTFYASQTWNAQPGRQLYHHSYVFVPARHLMKYGFNSPMVYVYGVGNTAMFAAGMKLFGENLTGYFTSIPYIWFISFLVLALVVLYISRSVAGTLTATVAALGCFMAITPEAIDLAVGFNPSRYIGLLVQIATVFSLFRGPTPVRMPILFIGGLFSLFWNVEFGLIGCVAQGLALLAPRGGTPLLARIISAAAFALASLATLYLLSQVGQSESFIRTVWVTFFNIAVPVITKTWLTRFWISAALFTAAGIYLAASNDRPEMYPKLCMLPMLAVLQTKYLVNPSFVHVWFTLLLTLTVAILFVPWREWKTRRSIAVGEIISVLAIVLCFVQLRPYNTKANDVARYYYSFYQLHSWSDLGENLKTPTPSARIAERVQAVRERAGTYDKILILSPFDFLMGFYANPEQYCGHFDILTNLITFGTINSIVECVKKSPKVMVVYDEALNVPCTEARSPFTYDRDSCEAKRKLKEAENGLLREIKPYLVETSKAGSLTFYSSNDGEAGAKVTAAATDGDAH